MFDIGIKEIITVQKDLSTTVKITVLPLNSVIVKYNFYTKYYF